MSDLNIKPRNSYVIMGTHVWSGPYGNLGVNALGNSLMRLLAEADESADFVLLGLHSTPHDTTRVRPSGLEIDVPVVRCRLSFSSGKENLFVILAASLAYRLIPLQGFRSSLCRKIPWIDYVSKAKLVGDVVGGDSFSDIYGMRRYVINFLAVLSVIILRGDIVQFPQTYGPFKSRMSQWMARYILNHSRAVVARDKKSQEVAQKMLSADLGKQVMLSPDVAFALWVKKPELPKFQSSFELSKAPTTIGINVNGLMLNGGYNQKNMFGLKLEYREFLNLLLNYFLQNTECDIALIPHTITKGPSVESDNEASVELWSSLSEGDRARVHYLDQVYDCHETKGVIGMCDFFIGSRMHSCIAALSQGVPCVGVAYSRKFAGVFASVGSEDWVIDGKEVTAAEAVAQILDLYKGREVHKEVLRQEVAQAQGRLHKIFSTLVKG